MFENPEKRVEQVNFPKALEKAEKIINDYQINPQDFDDLYDKVQISEDIEYVKERKLKWTNQSFETHDDVNKKLATIFEAIIFTEGESSEWFGSNVSLIKTSDYDDIKNGVDAVAEYDLNDSVSRVAMAIDVTFNHDVKKKISKIKENIKNGKLTKVKYFESELDDMRGELSNIPHIIVGADVDTVRELVNEWSENNSEVLGNHGVQFQFLEESIMQCEYFSKYAMEEGQDKIAQKYDSIRRVLENQLEDKNIKDNGTRDSFMGDFQKYLT